jgi:hypothetical protein
MSIKTKQEQRADKIADLLETIHTSGNDKYLDSVCELFAMTKLDNNFNWAITATGLHEYISRLFQKAHTQAFKKLADQRSELLNKINEETSDANEVH